MLPRGNSTGDRHKSEMIIAQPIARKRQKLQKIFKFMLLERFFNTFPNIFPSDGIGIRCFEEEDQGDPSLS